MTSLPKTLTLPNLFSGAFRCLAALFIVASFFTAPIAAQAQVKPPVPSEDVLARLIWGTMVTVDNANRTGDYGVLRALGTTGFQRSNSEAALAAGFSGLRANRVDVGRAILSTPTYYYPPAVMPNGKLRVRGGFDFRPKSIRFDVIFAIENGGWQVDALSVVEMDYNLPKR